MSWQLLHSALWFCDIEMQDNYIDWFNFNYINYGEYSGDPELQAEGQFCNTTLYGQVESIVEKITPN